MKIAVLTNKNSVYGKKILNDLILHKVKLEAVVVLRPHFKYYKGLFNYVKRRVGLLDSIYFGFERLFDYLTEKPPTFWNGKLFIKEYKDVGVPILYTRGTNSKKTISFLKDIAPDLLILAQVGIVGEEIIKIPRLGVLNAHPAILPYYRGIDCVRWAIYAEEFDKIGCTVHWVDKGVDTGNIILTRNYNFLGDETIKILDVRLRDLSASALTEVIFKKTIPKGEKQSCGRQYYKMPRKTECIVRKKLKSFLSDKKSITFNEKNNSFADLLSYRNGKKSEER